MTDKVQRRMLVKKNQEKSRINKKHLQKSIVCQLNGEEN